MRLIHEVVEDLRNPAEDEELTPLGAVLQALLGGERGSLPDLADRFTAAGLGHVMASWTGDGPDLRVSTRDLRHILGEERVQDMATLAGLPPGDLVVHLARLLPGAVRRMASEARLEVPSGHTE